ncbi:MAG TPA: hypothetical protein DCP90_05710 [Clostridiales bacterium]|nr:MAG: hypothetical protein A2Y22_04965 [Clostridiales bacterium GWD2_32_59]HAN10097.1 hypothetical protein [Clostridiales bacterium]
MERVYMEKEENPYVVEAYDKHGDMEFQEAINLFGKAREWYVEKGLGLSSHDAIYYDNILRIGEMCYCIGNSARDKLGILLKENGDSSLQKEMEELAIENYKEAKLKYYMGVLHSPDRPEAYVELGNLYIKLAEYDEAEDALLVGYSLQPENQIICNNVASCYNYMGQYDKAIPYAKKAIKLSEENLEELKELLKKDEEEVSVEEVEAQIQALSAMNSNIGFLYFNEGKFKEAVVAFGNAIKYCPENDSAIESITYIANLEEDSVVPKEIIEEARIIAIGLEENTTGIDIGDNQIEFGDEE